MDEEKLTSVIRRSSKQWADTALEMEEALAVFYKLTMQAEYQGMKAVMLNDSHLLMYTVGSTWYAPHKKILLEQFYLRVGRGSGPEALEEIKELARAEGATGIIMATSLASNDAALGRLLAQSGYSPMSSMHYMEVPKE